MVEGDVAGDHPVCSEQLSHLARVWCTSGTSDDVLGALRSAGVTELRQLDAGAVRRCARQLPIRLRMSLHALVCGADAGGRGRAGDAGRRGGGEPAPAAAPASPPPPPAAPAERSPHCRTASLSVRAERSGGGEEEWVVFSGGDSCWSGVTLPSGESAGRRPHPRSLRPETGCCYPRGDATYFSAVCTHKRWNAVHVPLPEGVLECLRISGGRYKMSVQAVNPVLYDALRLLEPSVLGEHSCLRRPSTIFLDVGGCLYKPGVVIVYEYAQYCFEDVLLFSSPVQNRILPGCASGIAEAMKPHFRVPDAGSHETRCLHTITARDVGVLNGAVVCAQMELLSIGRGCFQEIRDTDLHITADGRVRVGGALGQDPPCRREPCGEDAAVLLEAYSPQVLNTPQGRPVYPRVPPDGLPGVGRALAFTRPDFVAVFTGWEPRRHHRYPSLFRVQLKALAMASGLPFELFCCVAVFL